jgi:hypothetical protein
MAKQKTMADMVPEIPEAVATAAEAYLKPKRQIANLRAKMNGALEVLISTMHEHDLKEILVDDNEKRLILKTKDLVLIQKRKKADTNGDADSEEE